LAIIPPALLAAGVLLLGVYVPPSWQAAIREAARLLG
jgi:hypothetical protein